MSKMIPRRSIDTFRVQMDVTVDLYGIPCTLYIPSTVSANVAERLDPYSTPDDYTQDDYTAQVFIEWKPGAKRLRKLGLHTEDEKPILSWFGRKATHLSGPFVGTKVDVDITLHSWISIQPEFVPGEYLGEEEFELVDVVVPENMIHDAVIGKGFKLAPRRVNS